LAKDDCESHLTRSRTVRNLRQGVGLMIRARVRFRSNRHQPHQHAEGTGGAYRPGKPQRARLSKTHERIGKPRRQRMQASHVTTRRLVIRNRGRARPVPARKSRETPRVTDNPARGKAQGRIASADNGVAREADRRRERSPEVEPPLIKVPGRSLLQISSFSTGGRSRRRKSIGAWTSGGKRHVGPDRRKRRTPT
jgi:hypothetical protein